MLKVTGWHISKRRDDLYMEPGKLHIYTAVLLAQCMLPIYQVEQTDIYSFWLGKSLTHGKFMLWISESGQRQLFSFHCYLSLFLTKMIVPDVVQTITSELPIRYSGKLFSFCNTIAELTSNLFLTVQLWILFPNENGKIWKRNLKITSVTTWQSIAGLTEGNIALCIPDEIVQPYGLYLSHFSFGKIFLCCLFPTSKRNTNCSLFCLT